MVAPADQGRGVGDLLMGEVFAYLATSAAPGATVNLMGATGKGGFYERYGYARRPATAPGMLLTWDPSSADAAPRPAGA